MLETDEAGESVQSGLFSLPSERTVFSLGLSSVQVGTKKLGEIVVPFFIPLKRH